MKNNEYNEKKSNIDPFLKPHELDRAPTKLAEESPIDLSIPDISNWTVDDVYDYFMEYHPEAAPLLRDQVRYVFNLNNYDFQPTFLKRGLLKIIALVINVIATYLVKFNWNIVMVGKNITSHKKHKRHQLPKKELFGCTSTYL